MMNNSQDLKAPESIHLQFLTKRNDPFSLLTCAVNPRRYRILNIDSRAWEIGNKFRGDDYLNFWKDLSIILSGILKNSSTGYK